MIVKFARQIILFSWLGGLTIGASIIPSQVAAESAYRCKTTDWEIEFDQKKTGSLGTRPITTTKQLKIRRALTSTEIEELKQRPATDCFKKLILLDVAGDSKNICCRFAVSEHWPENEPHIFYFDLVLDERNDQVQECYNGRIYSPLGRLPAKPVRKGTLLNPQTGQSWSALCKDFQLRAPIRW